MSFLYSLTSSPEITEMSTRFLGCPSYSLILLMVFLSLLNIDINTEIMIIRGCSE